MRARRTTFPPRPMESGRRLNEEVLERDDEICWRRKCITEPWSVACSALGSRQSKLRQRSGEAVRQVLLGTFLRRGDADELAGDRSLLATAALYLHPRSGRAPNRL